MDRLVVAYKAKAGNKVYDTIDVENIDDAFDTAIDIASGEDIFIEEADFDEEGYMHGYDEEGSQVATFQYINMHEYEEYMEEYGDDDYGDEDDED